MLESEKKFYKKSQLKREYWSKKMKVEDIMNILQKLIREKAEHIETIKKEGLSVVEYSFDKNDIPRISEEMKKLEEVKKDMDILGGYYNIWLKK